MTSPPATSSDTANNGSRASGKSGKHQPSAPSTHYTSEKVAPTSLGMSLFLDAPLPPGTDSDSHQTPGKTFIGKPLKDLPNGQSGTGRLSFLLRKLQRNAKHPAFYDSLRSVKGKAVSRLDPVMPPTPQGR